MVYMTSAELRHRYNNMDENYDRLGVLAELNGCEKREISNALHIQIKIKPRKQITYESKSSENDAKMLQMWQMGCSDVYIAEKLGTYDKAVWQWRQRNHLPSNRPRGRSVTKEDKRAWDVLFG